MLRVWPIHYNRVQAMDKIALCPSNWSRCSAEPGFWVAASCATSTMPVSPFASPRGTPTELWGFSLTPARDCSRSMAISMRIGQLP